MDNEIKSPEEMTDEELAEFLGEEQEPKEEPEEKPKKPEDSEAEDAEEDEEQEEEQSEEAEDEESEEEEQQEDEEEKPVSRRKQARLDKLAKIFENIQSSDEESEEEAPKPKKPEGIKYQEDLDTDEDTAKRLEDDREKFGQAMYQQGLEQAKGLKQQQDAFEFKQMLTREEDLVRTKFKFMDPTDSEHFNEDATSKMVTKYLHFVGFDPQTKTARNPISYFDYVDAEMEMVQALAEEMASETQKNVTKQAANTGLRPSGSAPSKSLNLTKAPEDMTNEELDAMIELTVPTKKRQ